MVYIGIRRDGGGTLMVGLVDIVTVRHRDLFRLRRIRKSAEIDSLRIVSLLTFATVNVDSSVVEGLGLVIRVSRVNSEHSMEVNHNFVFLSRCCLAPFQCSWRFIEKLLSWCNML